ncbi:MAG: VWA domain-containing protein [Chloroflexota bacterium]
MTIDFAQPLMLILLLVLPVLVLLHRASRNTLPLRRRRLVLAARLAVTTLLVLAVAEPRLFTRADRVAVAFLTDASDSTGADGRERQIQWLRQAFQAAGDRDEAMIIAFGADTAIERPLSSARDLSSLSSVVDSSRTNLAGAVRLALAALPTDRLRKIVLLSDGNENMESVLEQAKVATSARVPISVLPLGARLSPEILVRSLETPSFIREGENFSASVSIESTTDGPARLHLISDGKLVSTSDVEITTGSNTFVLPQEPQTQGFHLFRVQLETPNDTYSQNNEAGSYTVVAGRPRVLVLEGEAGETRYLADALRSAGLTTDVRVVGETAIDSQILRGYESVVLANVPANRLTLPQMRSISSYVQNLGGGLVVVGGERSYGVGRYGRTPLEEALPVRMDLRGRTLTASVALNLVIDVSGSMAGGPGASKMDLAKEAAIRATEFLGEQDQLGILAFDDSNKWLQEPNFLTDPQAVQVLIGTLSPGGGTSIFPAVESAYFSLVPLDAKVKHIILLTDGLSTGGDYDTLTNNMRAQQVTLSTVAIGSDADFNLLRRLADLGNGRYYEGNDPFDLPQLVVKETQEVARAAIVEEEFRPLQVGSSPIMEGVDPTLFPSLRGYVSTTPKPSSQIVLVSKLGDPLLSEWQYGLGRVVAWTSDAKNRWATDWVGWPDFNRFWAQMVKRTLPVPIDRNTAITIHPEQGAVRITVDSSTDDKSYLNFLTTHAVVVSPDQTHVDVPLPQVAPGRYETRVTVTQEGAHFINVVQQDPSGQLLGGRPAGFVVPYSPEYRDLRTNPDLLTQLARATGGKVLIEPAEAFAIEQASAGQPRELWPWLLALAALLFMFDIAARRLRLAFVDVQRGWVMAQEQWRDRGNNRSREVGAQLFRARTRGNSSIPTLHGPEDGSPPAGGTGSTEPIASSSSLGSRLLDAKRRAGGKY